MPLAIPSSMTASASLAIGVHVADVQRAELLFFGQHAALVGVFQQHVGLVELVRALQRGDCVHEQALVCGVLRSRVLVDRRGLVVAAKVGKDPRTEGRMLRVFRLGLSREAIHRGQRVGIFLVAVLDHRQVVHDVEVAVVVQPVGIDRLLEIISRLEARSSRSAAALPAIE